MNRSVARCMHAWTLSDTPQTVLDAWVEDIDLHYQADGPTLRLAHVDSELLAVAGRGHDGPRLQ